MTYLTQEQKDYIESKSRDLIAARGEVIRRKTASAWAMHATLAADYEAASKKEVLDFECIQG